MKTYYGLIGAGGHGREIMPWVRRALRHDIDAGTAELFFVEEGIEEPKVVNGQPVKSLDHFLSLPDPKRFNVAIANSQVRERIAGICKAAGAVPFPIQAENIVMLDYVEAGEGLMLSPFVTIGSNVKIGAFFQANMYSYVAHDCVIGDFVTFGPAVKCNGNIVIEDHALIGAGALIRQGRNGRKLTIGRGAVVGLGAVVIKNVPPGVTVFGNPARPLKNSEQKRKRTSEA